MVRRLCHDPPHISLSILFLYILFSLHLILHFHQGSSFYCWKIEIDIDSNDSKKNSKILLARRYEIMDL